MLAEMIETETFEHYPDAKRYIDFHHAEGRACLVTNCNDGFIVDIYTTKKTV